MCAVVYVTVFVVGLLTCVAGLAANVLASAIPVSRRFNRWYLIGAGAVLAIGSGSIAVLQYTSTESQPTSSVSRPSPPPESTPATRTPSQWASEVEAVCEPMGSALNDNLHALQKIDKAKVQANDKDELAAFVAALRGFYGHYSTLTRQLHDIELPSYGADAAGEWLRLFNERGEGLYAGIQRLESGGLIDRLQGAYAMYTYGTDSDKVLAKAKQLGIESCP